MAKLTFTARVTSALVGLTVGNTICASATGKLVKSIGTRGATLDVDVHAAAVAALTLSSLHRDANMLKLLLNAMPMQARAQTLAQWAEHFGNVKVSFVKGKGFSVKMLPEADCTPVDLVKAQATPFWTKPEVVPGVFNDAALLAAVDALIKRCEGKKAELSEDAKRRITDLKVVSVKLTPVEPKAVPVEALAIAA